MRSMTGFGRASGEVLARRCVVEVRSVNHRFLDLKLRLSPEWADPVIEQLLGQAVRKRVERGSLVLSVRDEGVAQSAPVVRVDGELARAYGKALRELAHALGMAAPEAEHGPLPEATLWALLPLVASQPGVLLSGETGGDGEARFQQL